MRLRKPSRVRRAGSVLALLGAVGAIGVSLPLAAFADNPGPPTTTTPVGNACGPTAPILACPAEGPTVLEVGKASNGDVPADWTVAGYGYSAGDKYKVEIGNVKTDKVLDKTGAVAQNNGTITAQSPVYYIPPPKTGPGLDSGWHVTHPLPLCGVTLQATLTDVSSGASQRVITLACAPPPPPPK
jgi:hypothetical protein